MVDLRYPIGQFTWSGPNTPEQRQRFIDDIAAAPNRLRKAVGGLSNEQLETPYRPGGWSVRQVVHHVPESHMNSYVRFKLALTEENPTIKTYDEALWAQLDDVRTTPIEVSLALLESLHIRWVTLLRSLSAKDFERTFRHPEIGLVSLDKNIALYAWHGAHHVAHITGLRERMGWA
jgi:uncharacterized damage-inducible protein DinB